MFTLPQGEATAPTACSGSTSSQDMENGYGDVLQGECLRKPDCKQPKLYGVGDPVAMFSSDSSCLSSRGRVIKWFWDSAEEGYRTYHMDEYDEDKNPNVSEDPSQLGPKSKLTAGQPAASLLLSGWSYDPLAPRGLVMSASVDSSCLR